MIFYTKHEGGKVEKFPKSPAHWWALQQLEQNITTSEYLLRSEFSSDIFDDCPLPMVMKCSYLCGIRVHSVFFTKGNDLYWIFDSSIFSRYSNRMAFPKFDRKGFIESFREFIKSKSWQKDNQ